MLSELIVKPTVRAAYTKAGKNWQTSELLLPAAITTTMPEFTVAVRVSGAGSVARLARGDCAHRLERGDGAPFEVAEGRPHARVEDVDVNSFAPETP